MQRFKQEKLEFMGLLAVWLQCGHQSSARAEKSHPLFQAKQNRTDSILCRPKIRNSKYHPAPPPVKGETHLMPAALKAFWCSFVHGFEMCNKKLVHFQASELRSFSLRRKPTVHWHRNFKNAALKGVPWALTYTSCSPQPSHPLLY